MQILLNSRTSGSASISARTALRCMINAFPSLLDCVEFNNLDGRPADALDAGGDHEVP
jgi:hypothetical protein